jgi:predicted transposase YdaD
MHQDYDKIIKDTIKKSQQAILQHICKVNVVTWEELPRDVPRTVERRGDWLKIGTDALTQTKRLYHLEFQSGNDENIELRMLFYWVLYAERYKLPVLQYLIYLGEGIPTMPTFLQRDRVFFEYEVVAINTIDYELFLASSEPESIILSILADFKKEENNKVVEKILRALKNKSKNQQQLQKYIYQMELLANLRELQPVISKKVTEMSINYDLKKDFRYQQGRGEGRDEGRDEGVEITKRYFVGETPAAIALALQLDITEVRRIIAKIEAK